MEGGHEMEQAVYVAAAGQKWEAKVCVCVCIDGGGLSGCMG